MKNEVSDQDVLNLLSNLKNTERNYPANMIKARRDMYVKQAATMVALAGAGGNGGTNAGTVKTTVAGSTTGGGLATGKFLEIALVIALVVEAGIAAYIYRDKIADIINSTFSPNIETVASPPSENSSSEIIASEETPREATEGTSTAPVSETPAPSATLIPVIGDNNAGSNDGQNIQVESTPDPNDNSGLHLGQTKQPTEDSSKDKNNSNSNSKNE